MKIGIDARFWGKQSKGLGRYTQQLVRHLEEIDDENEYVIFLRKENFADYQPRNERFRKVCADFLWYSWAEQTSFVRLLRQERCDLMHFPHFNVPLLYTGRFVVTIHDLILLRFPTRRNSTRNRFFYALKFLAYKAVIASSIKRAEKICAVSRFTKEDILRSYPRTPEDKIVVTYEAVFEREQIKAAAKKKISEFLRKHGIIKPYILYVGNAYPHKNLERLCRVFAENFAGEEKLVLVGKDDFFYRRLRRQIDSLSSKKSRDILIVPNVADVELDILYRRAKAFVFPSLYEGFGLPPLEAAAYGVPVACSDHPCMREILGQAALFFDASDDRAFAAALQRIVSDEKLRLHLGRIGPLRAEKFSWRRMARQTLDIYRNCRK